MNPDEKKEEIVSIVKSIISKSPSAISKAKGELEALRKSGECVPFLPLINRLLYLLRSHVAEIVVFSIPAIIFSYTIISSITIFINLKISQMLHHFKLPPSSQEPFFEGIEMITNEISIFLIIKIALLLIPILFAIVYIRRIFPTILEPAMSNAISIPLSWYCQDFCVNLFLSTGSLCSTR